jgi:hypothetical protein
MHTAVADNIWLQASDITGQKNVKVAGVSPDSTIGELVKELLPTMKLLAQDSEGRPLTYHVRLDREGRHLPASALVSEVLQPGDRIVLQPHIMAG